MLAVRSTAGGCNQTLWSIHINIQITDVYVTSWVSNTVYEGYWLSWYFPSS